MTALSADSFERALTRFKKSIPSDLAHQFSTCTLQDLRNICMEIQQQHGREGKLQNMRRLGCFVEAMEQFSKVIEVFVNVNDFICFIWGPVKFLLGIARTYLDSYDKLLGVYEQVGNAIPGLQQYRSSFEKYPPLAQVLEDYYSDILNFHQAAVSVFKRPRWKTVFHSAWKTFDTKFRPILQSLASRRKLLESEKGSATLYEIQTLRQELSKKLEEQSHKVAEVILDLQAPNYAIDQETATEDRHRSKSGSWVFEHPQFQAWSKNDVTGHKALYVNGIPGADSKRQYGQKDSCIAYFFFKQNNPDKDSHNSLLRAVLEQLIEQDPVMSDHLFKELSVLEGTKLRSTQTLQQLVRVALKGYQVSYMVLDGLDDCTSDEASRSIVWFLSVTREGWKSPDAMLRVLFCGERDGILDKLLVDQPQISLESSRHVEDIRLYCETLCKQIVQKFGISHSMEKDIATRVATGAQGMFLYARVVLGNLLSQTKLSGLRREIEPGTFPQGIERAYERVAVRILEKSSTAERQDALNILAWVICAKRLLRWREIQSLFCIDPVIGVVDYEKRRLRVTCKDICGSLVDVYHAADRDNNDAEDIIRIVHDTAREFLTRKSYLDVSLENAKLATFCLDYLTSNPFRSGISQNEIVLQASQGYYGLQDYAVEYWFEHTRQSAQLGVPSDLVQFQKTMDSARRFLDFYSYSDKTDVTRDTTSILIDLPEDDIERTSKLDVEFRTALIWQGIETLHDKSKYPGVQESFHYLYGATDTYKCPKPWCKFFTAGFQRAEIRKQHVNQHDLPFRCSVEGCFASQLGFDIALKLQRHCIDHHAESSAELRFAKVLSKKEPVTVLSAASQGDLSRLRELLDSGAANDKACQATTNALLYLAVECGQFNICEEMLRRNADSNYANAERHKQTVMHAAVLSGNVDINRPDSLGRSPFMEACALGRLDIVKLLLNSSEIQVDRLPTERPQSCKSTIHALTISLGYAYLESHKSVVVYLLQLGQSSLFTSEFKRPVVQPVDDVSNNGFDQWSCIFDAKLPYKVHVDLVYLFLQESGVGSMDFSTDGKFLATVSHGAAQVFQLTTGNLLRKLQRNDIYVRNVSFSPNSTFLTTSSEDGVIRIWDFTSGTILKTFSDPPTRFCPLAVSPDGSKIISGPAGRIVIWDLLTGAPLIRLAGPSGHQASVSAASFSPNGNVLAARSGNGTIEIWNVDGLKKADIVDDAGDDRLIRTIKGHQYFVGDVNITPDAQWIISASTDGTVQFWNLHTGDSQLVFKGHRNTVIHSASSSNSPFFATVGGDYKARVWSYRISPW
ncbi:WD40 repeat-like protein [Xylariaceae sp. FL0255]|nr:WD40 repeat-like protein [Xylariaceae sp. FL0255]